MIITRLAVAVALAGTVVASVAACGGDVEVAPLPVDDREAPAGGGLDPGTREPCAEGGCGGVAAQPAPLGSAGDAVLDQGIPKSSVLRGLKVGIDVGHSATGSDPGAFGKGISEYAINLYEGQVLAAELRSRGALVSLFHYPQTTELDVRGRNAGGHHIFLSVHHNAYSSGDAQGTEVLVGTDAGQKPADRILASAINEAVVSALWGPSPGELDRGAKAMPLGVLRHAPTSVQAKCLTESFFITASGMTVTKARSMAEKAARAMARGIEAYWLQARAQSTAALSLDDTLEKGSDDGGAEAWLGANDVMALYRGH